MNEYERIKSFIYKEKQENHLILMNECNQVKKSYYLKS